MKFTIDVPDNATPQQLLYLADYLKCSVKDFFCQWGSPHCTLRFNEETGKYEQRWVQ